MASGNKLGEIVFCMVVVFGVLLACAMVVDMLTVVQYSEHQSSFDMLNGNIHVERIERVKHHVLLDNSCNNVMSITFKEPGMYIFIGTWENEPYDRVFVEEYYIIGKDEKYSFSKSVPLTELKVIYVGRDLNTKSERIALRATALE